MKPALLLFLLATLGSPAFAQSLEDITHKHYGALLSDLKTYIADNPEAADLDAAYDAATQAAFMADQHDELVGLLRQRFKMLTAAEAPEEQQVIQTGMVLAQFSIQQGQPEVAREVMDAFNQLAADGKGDNYEQVAGALKGMLGKPSVGATPELSGTTLEGNEISLEDYRGKVVLLDFWATWCGPCVEEIPNVKAVYDKYHDQGFEIIGVSLDRSVDPLKKFIDDKELAWPNLFDADQDSSLADQFGITSIPSLFLLDREGTIVALDPRGPRLEEEVKKLLGGE